MDEEEEEEEVDGDNNGVVNVNPWVVILLDARRRNAAIISLRNMFLFVNSEFIKKTWWCRL